MMKAALLHPLRLALILAPAYNIYVFSMGEGAGKPMDWWMDKAGFIAWALGSFMLMLLCSFLFRLNWAQLIIMCIGTAGLAYFYLTEEVYSFFLSLPEFSGEEEKKMLPVIPYAYTMIVLVLTWLFRTRFRPSAKS